jgi:hypothetical protein
LFEMIAKDATLENWILKVITNTASLFERPKTFLQEINLMVFRMTFD